MASFRICATLDCKSRLPDLKYDGHSKCVTCIGYCDVDNRCDECKHWPTELFASFLKHRHKLQMDRQRKSKSRQKARESKELLKLSATSDKEFDSDGPVSCKGAHVISPSGSSSNVSKELGLGLNDPLTKDDISLLSPRNLSLLSSSSVPKCLPKSPTAAISAPVSDQGISVSAAEFKELLTAVSNQSVTLQSLAQNVNLLMADRASSVSVHSASVFPPGQDLGSRPVVGLGSDPQSSGVLCAQVAGGPGSGGEPPTSGPCLSSLSPGPVRKEPKDSKTRPKVSIPAGETPKSFPLSRDTQHGLAVSYVD